MAIARMLRSIAVVFALCCVGLTVNCVGGPEPKAGFPAGSDCATNLDCESGLFCNCGTCAVEEGPPGCSVNIDANCPEEPSTCFAACGDETTVGAAECVEGSEVCSTGVLRDTCPVTTCWGEPAVGEICINGEWVCELGISANGVECYTADCVGEPGECRASCTDNFTYDQECIGGRYQCDFGVSVDDCGGCQDPRPDCLVECGGNTLSQAACDAQTQQWDCSFIAGAVLSNMCTDPDGGVVDGGPAGGCTGPAPGCVLECGQAPVTQALCSNDMWSCAFLAGGQLETTCPAPDAGAPDAGAADAGQGTDAGATDAGPNDAGPNDAGQNDAGQNDAGDAGG